jgi:hypothetical protein
MKLTQEEKDRIQFAIADAEALVKMLKRAQAYQEADIEKIRPFLLNAMGYTMNVHAYLQGIRTNPPTPGEIAYDKARAEGLSTADCLKVSREAEEWEIHRHQREMLRQEGLLPKT